MLRRLRQKKGFSILMYGWMLIFISGTMALGVDATTLYLIRTSLSTAADAAALAAGRSLNAGDSIDEADAAARATARKVFKANFKDGYMNTHIQDDSIGATFVMLQDAYNQDTGVIQITVTSSVSAPTYFMRYFGVDHVGIQAMGQSTRKGLVLLLVLDRSGSMGTRTTSVGTIPTGFGNSACEAMVYASTEFVDLFSAYDYLGLVSFASQPTVDYVPKQNFKGTGAGSLKKAIANIQCTGYTNTTGALELAYQEIQTKNMQLAMNSIVVFTDGMPNAVNGDYAIRQALDTRLGKAKNVSSTNPPDVPPGNRTNCLGYTKECIDMPVLCPSSGSYPPVRGAFGQGSGFASGGGARSNVFKSLTSDANPSFPAGCPTGAENVTSQSIAYIPQLDRWGNKTWGMTPPFRDNWLFDVNTKCAPAGTTMSPWAPTTCFETGGLWSAYPTYGPRKPNGTRINSNFFPSGHPYAGQLRSDMPNSVGAAAMNSAVSAAEKIRSNATYKIVISTMFMIGNNGDPVDREFLPIIANLPSIPALQLDPYAPAIPNPYYNSNQQTGVYSQIINVYDIMSAFFQLASSLLRLSA